MSGCLVCGKNAVGLKWNSRRESGLSQILISDYERDRLRLNADIVVRLANALEVTADDLLQPNGRQHSLRRKPSLRVLRRLEKIEQLPAHQQTTLLKTIDTFLRGATASR